MDAPFSAFRSGRCCPGVDAVSAGTFFVREICRRRRHISPCLKEAWPETSGKCRKRRNSGRQGVGPVLLHGKISPSDYLLSYITINYNKYTVPGTYVLFLEKGLDTMRSIQYIKSIHLTKLNNVYLMLIKIITLKCSIRLPQGRAGEHAADASNSRNQGGQHVGDRGT